jgi:hypothetical protein
MSNQQLHIRGITRYPHLNKPDTKFDDAGVYKTDLILDAATGSKLTASFERARAAEMQEVQARLKGKKAKAADLPVQPELDDTGEETGQFILRAKMKASGISKKTGEAWKRSLPLFDADGVPTNARVGGGSEVIACITPKAWSNPKGECSVTCYLEAIQIISLSAGGGATASRFGFGAVEGGFKSSEMDAADEDEDDVEIEGNGLSLNGDDDEGEAYEF